jgi:hypothetical protein
VTTGDHVQLGFPDRLTQEKHRCTITAVKLHHVGHMIAALVQVRHGSSGGSYAQYLVAWALAGYDDSEGTYTLVTCCY